MPAELPQRVGEAAGRSAAVGVADSLFDPIPDPIPDPISLLAAERADIPDGSMGAWPYAVNPAADAELDELGAATATIGSARRLAAPACARSSAYCASPAWPDSTTSGTAHGMGPFGVAPRIAEPGPSARALQVPCALSLAVFHTNTSGESVCVTTRWSAEAKVLRVEGRGGAGQERLIGAGWDARATRKSRKRPDTS